MRFIVTFFTVVCVTVISCSPWPFLRGSPPLKFAGGLTKKRAIYDAQMPWLCTHPRLGKQTLVELARGRVWSGLREQQWISNKTACSIHGSQHHPTRRPELTKITTRSICWIHGTQLWTAPSSTRENRSLELTYRWFKKINKTTANGVTARAITNCNIATLMKVNRSQRKFRKEKQQIGLQKFLKLL